MLCQFLLYSKVTQSYIYRLSFSHYLPSCSIPRDWTLLLFSFSFLAFLWHMEFLGRDQIWASSLPVAVLDPLIHCARLGIEPAYSCCRDAADHVAPQQEVLITLIIEKKNWGPTYDMQKFMGQGLNLCHSSTTLENSMRKNIFKWRQGWDRMVKLFGPLFWAKACVA